MSKRLTKLQLKEFVNMICEVLEIHPPSISTDMSNFESETMWAQYSVANDKIYVNMDNDPGTVLFAVAHELRHKWQHITDDKRFFDDYKPRSMFDRADEYNLQFAEIDAQAFGVLVMELLYKVEIALNGLSKKTEDIILDYSDTIYAETVKQFVKHDITVWIPKGLL